MDLHRFDWKSALVLAGIGALVAGCPPDDDGGDDAGMGGDDAMMDTEEPDAEPDTGEPDTDESDSGEPDTDEMDAADMGTEDGTDDAADGETDTDDGTDATATLQLIHNSPDPAAATVDVWLQGDSGNTLVVDDLEFRQATRRLTVPAGTNLNFAVAGGGSSDDDTLNDEEVVKQFGDLSFSADTNTVAVVNGVVSPSNFETERGLSLAVNSEARTESQSDGHEIVPFHGGHDVNAVDIGPRGSLQGGDNAPVDGLQYGSFGGAYISAGASQVFDIGTDGGTFVTNIQTPGSFSSGSGVWTVAASGFLTPGGDDATDGSNGPALRMVAFPNSVETVGPSDYPVSGSDGVTVPTAARAQLIHASRAEGYGEVDVSVAGTSVASGVGLGDATGFLSLPVGQDVNVTITPTSGGASDLTPSINLSGSGDASVATRAVLVRGGTDSKDAGLKAISARESRPGNPAAESGNVAFNAYHAATPDALSLVDLAVLDGSDSELAGFTGVSYDSATGVQTAPASDVAIIRISAGETNYDFDVGSLPSSVSLDGSYATFFAIQDSPAELYAVTEGGTSATLSLAN